MSKTMNRTTQSILRTALVFAACALPTSWTVAQDELGAELRRCASLPDEDGRIRCYDALAQRELQDREETEPPAMPPQPVESSSVPQESDAKEITQAGKAVAISDDIGREQVERDDEAGNVEYHARVTSCKKNSSGRLFFFLENGQIWKQTDYATFRYRTCDFDITLTKDSFGYKMKIAGKKSSYRVSRVQ